jgi:hypothetical protein
MPGELRDGLVLRVARSSDDTRTSLSIRPVIGRRLPPRLMQQRRWVELSGTRSLRMLTMASIASDARCLSIELVTDADRAGGRRCGRNLRRGGRG